METLRGEMAIGKPSLSPLVFFLYSVTYLLYTKLGFPVVWFGLVRRVLFIWFGVLEACEDISTFRRNEAPFSSFLSPPPHGLVTYVSKSYVHQAQSAS